MATTFATLALIAAASILLATIMWPLGVETPVAHEHPEMPTDHPHLREHGGYGGHRHRPMAGEAHSGLAST